MFLQSKLTHRHPSGLASMTHTCKLSPHTPFLTPRSREAYRTPRCRSTRRRESPRGRWASTRGIRRATPSTVGRWYFGDRRRWKRTVAAPWMSTCSLSAPSALCTCKAAASVCVHVCDAPSLYSPGTACDVQADHLDLTFSDSVMTARKVYCIV